VAPAEQRCPGAAGEQHRARPDGAALGDNAGDRTALDLEAACRAGLVDRHAELARRRGDRRRALAGSARAVARRVEAADPVDRAALRHRPRLGGAQHAAVHLMLARRLWSSAPAHPSSAESR